MKTRRLMTNATRRRQLLRKVHKKVIVRRQQFQKETFQQETSA